MADPVEPSHWYLWDLRWLSRRTSKSPRICRGRSRPGLSPRANGCRPSLSWDGNTRDPETTRRTQSSLLIPRGLVPTRPGDGTFVSERMIPFITTVFADLASG